MKTKKEEHDDDSCIICSHNKLIKQKGRKEALKEVLELIDDTYYSLTAGTEPKHFLQLRMKIKEMMEK